MPVMPLLKPEIKVILNEFIQKELYASNLYKHLANQMQRMGFFGVQKFFLNESHEEIKHYQYIVDYINDMGDVAAMPTIESCGDIILSIGNALDVAYEFELELMNDYIDFYKNADEVTKQFLLQFLEIQRKSVGEFGDHIARYNRNPGDVFEFDEYLGNLIK